MRFGRVRLAIACATVVAVAGCLFPSLGTLTGGPDAAPDSGSDVATPDASNDGSVVAFCASLDATFCEDFDDSNLTSFPKWDSVETTEGGSLARVDAGLSYPNAIAITFDPSSATGQVPEELGVHLPP